MARGFESKSVEFQQEEATRREAKRREAETAPAERGAIAERRTLELALARTEPDLLRAKHPAHREMLQSALAAIRERLASLSKGE